VRQQEENLAAALDRAAAVLKGDHGTGNQP
jgi:hypothetical protein